MKNKIHKILGVGITLVIAMALVMGFVAPVAASPGETINEWYNFDYPVEGADGDWFYDPSITALGPMAEAINDDLYVASGIGVGDFELGSSNDATAEWSTDKAYTGSYSVYLSVPTVDDYAEVYFSVSVKLEDIDPGSTSFRAWSTAGDWIPYFIFEMEGSYNKGSGDADLLWINNDAAASGPFVGDWEEFAASDAVGPWQWATIDTTTWTWVDEGWDTWSNLVTEWGDETVSCVLIENSAVMAPYPVSAYIDDITINGVTYKMDPKYLFKSTDGARSWAETDYADDLTGEGAVVDMVCSSLDADILYVTDGNYVYKTSDGGDTWSYVKKDSLEEQLEGACGCPVIGRPITSIDVTYDDNDNPYVFIGTRSHYANCLDPTPGTIPGSVYFIGEAGYPSNWSDLNLSCYSTGDYDALAVGCAPDWADSKETYVVVSNGSETHVVITTGGPCDWPEFAELLYDCVGSFGSMYASRIGFPDDWEDTETLFVGIVDEDPCVGDMDEGGDVYMAMDGSALDMNVLGITSGCIGVEPVDIISLDIEGDTEEARLIAGAYCANKVYCSEDGGWSWDASAKDPTGTRETYVLWVGDSALAATAGCECAVSLCCGEEFPCEFWNQISLISTDIDCVRFIDHSPGYLSDESKTIFMVTCSNCYGYEDNPCPPTNSVFRYDGTYWERVFCSTIAGADEDTIPYHVFWRVRVSPDFLTTNAVYVHNGCFEVWRSLDAGCSWTKLTFPCAPMPCIREVVVIDEDTVIAGGWHSLLCPCNGAAGYVYKTTRHGARPWEEYEFETTNPGGVISFDLEPGYEDPGSVLLGDDQSRVYISEDGGETWDLVGAAILNPTAHPTYVVFDPAYATSGIIYAAASYRIARCVIDPDAAWADQTWEVICDNLGYAAGIQAAGDTALYVADGMGVRTGVFRSLNPDAEKATDVIFEELSEGLDSTPLWGLWLTTDVSDEGCAENVLWSLDDHNCENIWVWEDTLAAPVVLAMPVNEQKLGTTGSATLSWNALCGADCYEVSLWKYCAECPDEKMVVPLEMDCAPGECMVCGPEAVDDLCACDPGECPCTSDLCIVVDGLESGTEYFWQVRVCLCKPFLSKWSEVRSFMTALLAVPFADLCSPACGSQAIILTPNFAWGPVTGATGYDIELATTETFTAGVVRGSSTVNAWVAPEPLEYATTHYWRVRAEKNGVYSAWTVCMFTTMGRPEVPPPPVTVEQTPPPQITVEVPVKQIAPNWIYAVIGIGAALVVVVIVLIVRTRRPTA